MARLSPEVYNYTHTSLRDNKVADIDPIQALPQDLLVLIILFAVLLGLGFILLIAALIYGCLEWSKRRIEPIRR